jgi:acetylornithine deacetylase/succinyl-diaminopimelate desuccinylase-like protein
MNLVDLTTKLISIPSFVSDNENEVQLGEYICQYITENIPWLKVYKEYIDEERFNVIAYGSAAPRVIFASHMDTVLATGNLQERLNAVQKDNQLFGLGAFDMKGGLACSLYAMAESMKTLPVALVFTCDEEYYFAGIKKFISDYKAGKLPLDNTTKPELVIFPEPSNLQIGYGCRGCVELEVTITGRSAHAGRPQAGINAIEKSVELVNILRTNLEQNCISELVFTTVNLASINGGVSIDGQIQSRANAIADTARIVLDIRTASKAQDVKYIITRIIETAKVLNIAVKEVVTRLDLAPYIAKQEELKILEKAISKAKLRVEFDRNPAFGGYGEFAMVGAELGWNAINFGPGPGGTAHQIKECVNVTDLKNVSRVYQELLKLLD